MTETFRIGFVPGVTPDKWLRIWARRLPEEPIEAVAVEDDEALAALHDGSVSMGLLRLPVDRAGMHVIPLYEEVPVVVASREQPPQDVPEWLAVASDEALHRARRMPRMSVKDAVSVVATGSGMVIVPMSVARLHHRKDVLHRPVTGVSPSAVGLVWRIDDADPRIEEFIGIVRGRTERSSRGTGQPRDTSSGAGGQKRTRTLPQRGAAPRRRGQRTRRGRR